MTRTAYFHWRQEESTSGGVHWLRLQESQEEAGGKGDHLGSGNMEINGALTREV